MNKAILQRVEKLESSVEILQDDQLILAITKNDFVGLEKIAINQVLYKLLDHLKLDIVYVGSTGTSVKIIKQAKAKEKK